MTPAARIDPRTATDLLFGPGATASEALARQILPQDANLDRALKRLPPPTRQAAVQEAATQAAGLLDADLLGLLVAGWRAHRDLVDSARRTRAVPGSTELVDLVRHQITTTQQPAVSVLVDRQQVATLRFTLSIVFDIEAVAAEIRAGLLVALHPGSCDATATLNFQGTDVLTTRTHLDVPGVIKVSPAIRLLGDDDHPAGGEARRPAA